MRELERFRLAATIWITRRDKPREAALGYPNLGLSDSVIFFDRDTCFYIGIGNLIMLGAGRSPPLKLHLGSGYACLVGGFEQFGRRRFRRAIKEQEFKRAHIALAHSPRRAALVFVTNRRGGTGGLVAAVQRPRTFEQRNGLRGTAVRAQRPEFRVNADDVAVLAVR